MFFFCFQLSGFLNVYLISRGKPAIAYLIMLNQHDFLSNLGRHKDNQHSYVWRQVQI